MKNKLLKTLAATIALSGTLMFSNGVVTPQKAQAAVTNAPLTVYEVTASTLNVRNSPSTASKVVDKLKNKDQIEIIKFYNSNWGVIKTTTTKTGIAYVSTKYIKKLPTTISTKTDLNLRSGASTKYKVLKVIPKGAKVSFLGYHKGSSQMDYNWAVVSYKGVKGYASTTYLNMK